MNVLNFFKTQHSTLKTKLHGDHSLFDVDLPISATAYLQAGDKLWEIAVDNWTRHICVSQ